MAILTCPGCGRGGLRVPDGRRGKVTCPSCGAEWFHPETIEFSEVEFRCSKSGARFRVISSRRSPLHKFLLKVIERAAPAPSPSREASTRNAVVHSSQMRGSYLSRWLTLIRKRKGRAVVPSVPAPAPRQETFAPTALTTKHDANEYNWAGFSCPYCSASSFVRCGAGHLACDGMVEVRNGRDFYQCFCGEAGLISGTIKSFEAKQSSARDEPDSGRHPALKAAKVSGRQDAVALPISTQDGPVSKQ